MRKKITSLLIISVLILLLVYLLWLRSDKLTINKLTQSRKDIVLRIGSISSSPKESTATYQLLAGYLKTKLDLKDVVVVTARSPLEMAILLKQNKEDVFIDNPFASFALQSTAGTDIALDTIEDGLESYRSVFVVAKSSKIQKLSDLKGKMLALKQENSASGYFLPKAALKKQGFILTAKDGKNSPVAANEIGYYFTNDTDATLDHIFKGKVPVGALGEDHFNSNIANYDNRLRILDYTEMISQHVISFRRDMDGELKQSVIDALLKAHTEGPGKKALEDIQIEKFKPLDKNGELYKNMHELSDQIKDETLTH